MNPTLSWTSKRFFSFSSSCLRCVCCGMFLPRGRVDWCLSCRWLIGDFRSLPLILPWHLLIEDGAHLDQHRDVQIVRAWPTQGLFLNLNRTWSWRHDYSLFSFVLLSCLVNQLILISYASWRADWVCMVQHFDPSESVIATMSLNNYSINYFNQLIMHGAG
jgi:hypothetical protein